MSSAQTVWLIRHFSSRHADFGNFFVLLFIFGVLVIVDLLPKSAHAQSKYAIAIHGGAGKMPAVDTRDARLAELNRVLDLGLGMLRDGHSSLNVVESVVRELEDCELFNAGRGCVLNEMGQHELDASIMDGNRLGCGAVAGVKTTRYPISLARAVMTNTKHVLLSGSGADEFAVQLGLEQADADHFVTDRQRQRYLRWKATTSLDAVWQSCSLLADASPSSTTEVRTSLDSEPGDDLAYYGTVGCVVLDHQGNLAAGTSTGGLLGKRWGRIGDSPIIGAGNFADNATCAVSGTGVGEEFIRFAIASDIAARMRYSGLNLETACRHSLARLPEDCGGVVCVDREGAVFAHHNTPAMSIAMADANGLRVVRLFPDSVAGSIPADSE